MDLRTYCEERGRSSELARKLGVTQVTVSQWASGIKRVPATRCMEIERATEAVVTCEELRPDLAALWQYMRGTAKSEEAA